ncbi:MAG: acyl carrier protein [Lachnospiraceae bacterium]|jgi:acyl carrier protein|nr:acyl carrier protein [Lachnospiraceae bacterium]
MEQKFKEIAERYCTLKADEITSDMKLRDDLGLSSLDLMTLLGDIEDEFDIEFEFGEDDSKLAGIVTVEDAINLMKEYAE